VVFFTYIDWTTEEIARAFYVGKGSLKRTRKRERNLYWERIAAKYGWRREVILATKDERYAFDEEIRCIAELGTFASGETGCWGANLTAGGEGVSGYKHTKNHIESITGRGNPFFGKQHTSEIIEMNRHVHIGSNNACYGKKRPEEVAAKTRGINNGMYGRRGAAHPMFGSKHLHALKGENHPRTTLTWIKVEQIRMFHLQGTPQTEIATLFEVAPSVIWRIVHNKSWIRR